MSELIKKRLPYLGEPVKSRSPVFRLRANGTLNWYISEEGKFHRRPEMAKLYPTRDEAIRASVHYECKYGRPIVLEML